MYELAEAQSCSSRSSDFAAAAICSASVGASGPGVDRDEAFARAARNGMDGLRHRTLAGAVFAGDEHVGFRRSDPGDELQHRQHLAVTVVGAGPPLDLPHPGVQRPDPQPAEGRRRLTARIPHQPVPREDRRPAAPQLELYRRRGEDCVQALAEEVKSRLLTGRLVLDPQGPQAPVPDGATLAASG